MKPLACLLACTVLRSDVAKDIQKLSAEKQMEADTGRSKCLRQIREDYIGQAYPLDCTYPRRKYLLLVASLQRTGKVPTATKSSSVRLSGTVVLNVGRVAPQVSKGPQENDGEFTGSH